MWEEDVLRDIGFTGKTVQYILDNYVKGEPNHQSLDYWVKHYIEMYFEYNEDKSWRA